MPLTQAQENYIANAQQGSQDEASHFATTPGLTAEDHIFLAWLMFGSMDPEP